ncbi:MAG: tRNA (N6-isopentenyl adenosine(37)-C2)-methylthiotransferase MiaB [Proteobacteria bacterium]|nr:tRNA (N6-isopentenyl adenosine(37)-C2)-methylthiotransferase MiaB [Pseudomonadota bacterium]
MTRKFYIKTFGCQMNEHDSAKMALLLQSQGYAPGEDALASDIVIFNTCTIREKAHHKAISEIGRASQIKRASPRAVVGVCGCVAQEEGERILSRFPDVDFVLGPDQIWRLGEAIACAESGGRCAFVDLIDDPDGYRFPGHIPPVTSHESRVTAFVTAMKGCNCACSYCIVPSVRGREVCRPPGEIVEECRTLADSGTKEVTLLGQNVTAYSFLNPGSLIPGAESLASLIRRISRETGISRIRFTSPHPRDITDGLIGEFAENERLAPHIHLPAQSGSDGVLRRMRRGYTRERYLDVARRLRAARPGISITTDIIVGFSRETDEEYRETLDLMREVGFDSAFAFKYSPRPGTEAARKMEDDVPAGVKERRLDELLALQRSASRRLNEALVGSEGEVLAAGLDRMGRGLITGRLPDNRIVHFSGQEELIGSIVRVRITSANDNSLTGEALA